MRLPEKILRCRSKFWLALVVLCFAVCFLLPPARFDPFYSSRGMRVWLADLQSEEATSQEAAKWAIDKFGTNYLPALASELEAHDSPLKVALINLSEKQSVIKFRWTRASDHLFAVLKAFKILGERTTPIIPKLYEMYSDPRLATNVIAALCISGTNGVREAMNLVSSDQKVNHELVAFVFKVFADPSEAHKIPADCVAMPPKFFSAATNCLNGPDPELAPRIVGLFDEYAKRVRNRSVDDTVGLTNIIPVLIGLLSTNPPVRSVSLQRSVIINLESWGTEAVSAAPHLLPLLQSSDKSIRFFCANALLRIAPETVATNIDALLIRLRTTNPTERLAVISSLQALGTNALPAKSILIFVPLESLGADSQKWTESQEAGLKLLETIDPSPSELIAQYVYYIDKFPEKRLPYLKGLLRLLDNSSNEPGKEEITKKSLQNIANALEAQKISACLSDMNPEVRLIAYKVIIRLSEISQIKQ
jgi:hypothetical protein